MLLPILEIVLEIVKQDSTSVSTFPSGSHDSTYVPNHSDMVLNESINSAAPAEDLIRCEIDLDIELPYFIDSLVPRSQRKRCSWGLLLIVDKAKVQRENKTCKDSVLVRPNNSFSLPAFSIDGRKNDETSTRCCGRN